MPPHIPKLLLIASLLLAPSLALGESLVLGVLGTDIIGGLDFNRGDLIIYDPDTDRATLFFENDVLFPTGIARVDALHVLPNGHLILSTSFDETLGNLAFGDGDLVEFDPVSGEATLFFAESLFASGNEDIDAVSILPTGEIVLSTKLSATLAGVDFEDGDLIRYDPLTGTAAILVSEDAFSGNADIDAVHVLPDGRLLLSIVSGLDEVIGGVTVRDGDIFELDPVTGAVRVVISEDVFSQAGSADIKVISAVPGPPVPEPMPWILMSVGVVMALRHSRGVRAGT